MPIYEYQCQACGEELEALQKMSDSPLRDCPACNKPSLQKKISAVGFRLKGDGWYETDFKSGEKRNIAGSSAESGKSSDTPKTKSENKSAKSVTTGDKAATG